jgi:hypothetical protein
MRLPRPAAVAIAAVLASGWAHLAAAEIRTDRLSGRQLGAWRQVAAVVMASDPASRLPLHPTLHGLWQEVASSRHVLQIELARPAGSSAIAGRFRIEGTDPDGRLRCAILLNLRVIDLLLIGWRDAQLVPFGGLGRAKRRAKVLGHELAHAAWAFQSPEQARLSRQAQTDGERLATAARTVGTGGAGFAAAVEANERLTRLLEQPALAAEAAIAAELLASSSH